MLLHASFIHVLVLVIRSLLNRLTLLLGALSSNLNLGVAQLDGRVQVLECTLLGILSLA